MYVWDLVARPWWRSGVLAFYRLMLDASHHSARFEVLRNVEDVQERSIFLEDLESLMYDKSSGLFLVCLCAIHISYHPCFDPVPHKTPGLREICHDRRTSAFRVLSYFHNHWNVWRNWFTSYHLGPLTIYDLSLYPLTRLLLRRFGLSRYPALRSNFWPSIISVL